MSTDTQDSAPAGVKPVAWMDKLISLVVAYGDSRHFEVEAVDKRDAVCRTTQAFADLMEHVRRAPVAAQPDVTQQTLDDVKAGIPARDAEIEALRKEIEALQSQHAATLASIEAFVACDASAISYLTLGEYRTALLKMLREAPAEKEPGA